MALYIQLSTQNVFTKYLSISSITGGNSVNTEQLTSTVASLATNSVVPPFISTQALFASSVTTSSLTTSSLTTTFLIASSLTTSSITANSVTSGVMSTLVLYASSIVGVTTGGGGIASIPSVLSTFAILTSSLQVSTVVANTLSTQQLFTSSLQGNNLVASNIFVSSGVLSTFSTNAVNFASGFGYLTMPDIYPNSVYTSTVTTSNLLVGTNSVISPIQFFGFGTYSNTVISELSTGGTTQELLFFRGSNASDRIRMQTTGSVVFEPGVSARIWPTAPSNVTPAMIINTSSNVGIQTATPGTALDVAGTSRAIILSSQQLFTSSIQTTNLLINGTGVARFTGTTSTNLYGSGVDTFTLQASTTAYSTGVASLAFANNTSSYPLGRMYAIDSAFSGSSISQIVFQTVPTPASTFSTVYTAIGSTQSFTVPLGVSLLQVSMWGAGGSGGNGGPGGAGAFLQGILSVNPGQQLNLIVGQGGVFNTIPSSFGGGGTGTNEGFSGPGGGRSAVQVPMAATIVSSSGTGTIVTYTTSVSHELQAGEPVIITGLSPAGFNGTFAVLRVISANQFTVTNTQSGSSTGTGSLTAELLTVGAGGAGPQNGGGINGGAGTFSGTAFTAPSVYGGGGGSQTAGGAAGTSGSTPAATAGSILQGGGASRAGGGGGGGYYGGGGGGWTQGVGNGGGGGGSSYISNASFTFLTGSNSPNSSNTAPATTSPFYQSGVAAGGAANGNGGGGLIVFASIGGFLSESMRINSNGYVGIQNNTPRTTLDVGGTGRFITLSTLNINVSTINGQVFGFPINSTVIGLGTAGYVSSLSLVSTVQGLGTSGYISSSQLLSTTSGLIDIPELLSSIAGLGSAGYISSLTMTSSINGAISSLSTAYGTIGGGGAISYLSSYTVSTGSIFTSSIITSSLLNTDGISTYSLTVYGPSTLTVQGYAYFTSIVSSYSLITGNVGFIDPITQQPVYLQATNGSITLNGSVALTQPILNSTVQGLGTVGYISTATGGSTTLPANISSITLSTFAIYASSIMVPYVYTPQYFTF